MLHILMRGGGMGVSSHKRVAQVLFSLALEGPMTIYGLAKFISRYTGESFQSLRVILYRVLPLLLKRNLIEIKKSSRRNQVDITIDGFYEIFSRFFDKEASMNTDLLIAYSLEKRYDVNGLLFIISLYYYRNYYDFLNDPFYPYPLSIDTQSIKVVYNWNKNRDTIMLKELSVDYDYILNSLSDYYEPLIDEDYLYSEEGPLKLSLESFLTEYLLRLLLEKELLIMSFRFFEDYGKILKNVLSDIFLLRFSNDFLLLYDQIRIYELLREQGYISTVKEVIFLPDDSVVKEVKSDIEKYLEKMKELKEKALRKYMESKKGL